MGKVIFSSFCLLVLANVVLFESVAASSMGINPPIFEGSDTKSWDISERLAVGSLVKAVRAESHKDYPVTFTIVKGRDLSTKPNSKLPLTLPLRIDSRTGEVFLSESVQGRGNEKFQVEVIARNKFGSSLKVHDVHIVSANR